MSAERAIFTPKDVLPGKQPQAREDESAQETIPAAEEHVIVVFPNNKPPYTHEETQAFLKERIAAGAFLIPGELRKTKEGAHLAKANNILGSYYMTPATQEQIGRVYPSKKGQEATRRHRENIRQIIQNRMRIIWEQSPKVIQDAFPWETLPLGKPIPVQRNVRQSQAQGGLSIKGCRNAAGRQKAE